MKTFEELGVSPEIRRAIEEMGYENPMPVQEEVIPYLLGENNDVVALAQTGTGKTAAFGLPLLQQIDVKNRIPQSLILCPTRELCLQIAGDLNDYSKYIDGLKVLPVYGGSSIDSQIRSLKRGVHIIVATPGRLLDLMERKTVSLSTIRNVVMDEADEMLNMGFTDSINAILADVPQERNTLLFSATMSPEIARISKNYLRNAKEITIGRKNESTSNVKHVAYTVHAKDKYEALKRIVDYYPQIYGIIFCRTRKETQEIADKLMQEGYNADSLHGELSQAQRDAVMQKFRVKNLQLLVATDVAARGLDVDNLTHVINYSIPQSTEAYVHRIGRTGRAGKRGIAITFVTPGEMRQLGRIRREIRAEIRKGSMPTVEQVLESKKQRFAAQARRMIDEHEHCAYLGFAEELLTLCDHPAEMLAAILRMRFKNELLPESYVDLTPKKENVNPDRKGNSRVRFGIGKEDGVSVPEILDFIFDKTKIKSFQLGRIDCGAHETFVNATPEDAKRIFPGRNG